MSKEATQDIITYINSCATPSQRPQTILLFDLKLPSMPKKHRNPRFAKPANIVHHSLLSSSSRRSQNASPRASSEQQSVNDLISHLRRTQVSISSPEDGSGSLSRLAIPHVPRTVHPSLRNLLELPETPPPRPRPNASRVSIGARRLRVTPGPPPPESWVLGSAPAAEHHRDGDLALTDADKRVIYRLERLPGVAFPRKDGLVHMVLKAMAMNWAWHVEYDGLFLARLPCRVKMLLLSYIAVYARDAHLERLMRGLSPLFPKQPDGVQDQESDGDATQLQVDADSEVSRLDLGGALGRWLTFKQLTSELVTSPKAKARSETRSLQLKPEDAVPASWDEEETGYETPEIPSPFTLNPALRFRNLRFLSLAHPNQATANWNSLINLLSSVSTITHLSLAHWPVPTLTPNAKNASIRHPTHKSLSFSYSGTDSYSAMENNWAEAAVILRKLSRVTYCLKWLDLEGCGDWIRALCWEGVGPDGESYGSTDHIWNGPWRDIEWVGLGPGWIPLQLEDAEFSSSHGDGSSVSSGPSNPRSLASSIHAPGNDNGANVDDLPWDVEVERIKYRHSKEAERFRVLIDDTRDISRRILQVRREGRGKWIRFSLGFEGVNERLVEKLLGQGFSSDFA